MSYHQEFSETLTFTKLSLLTGGGWSTMSDLLVRVAAEGPSLPARTLHPRTRSFQPRCSVQDRASESERFSGISLRRGGDPPPIGSPPRHPQTTGCACLDSTLLPSPAQTKNQCRKLGKVAGVQEVNSNRNRGSLLDHGKGGLKLESQIFIARSAKIHDAKRPVDAPHRTFEAGRIVRQLYPVKP
jgi:hypothetical protein